MGAPGTLSRVKRLSSGTVSDFKCFFLDAQKRYTAAAGCIGQGAPRAVRDTHLWAAGAGSASDTFDEGIRRGCAGRQLLGGGTGAGTHRQHHHVRLEKLSVEAENRVRVPRMSEENKTLESTSQGTSSTLLSHQVLFKSLI